MSALGVSGREPGQKHLGFVCFFFCFFRQTRELNNAFDDRLFSFTHLSRHVPNESSMRDRIKYRKKQNKYARESILKVSFSPLCGESKTEFCLMHDVDVGARIGKLSKRT